MFLRRCSAPVMRRISQAIAQLVGADRARAPRSVDVVAELTCARLVPSSSSVQFREVGTVQHGERAGRCPG